TRADCGYVWTAKPLSEVGAVLGKALEVFFQGKPRLAAAAQVELGRDQPECRGAICRQLRIALKVALDAGVLAGLEAAFQFRVRQFNEQFAWLDVAGLKVRVDAGPMPALPGLCKLFEDLP